MIIVGNDYPNQDKIDRIRVKVFGRLGVDDRVNRSSPSQSPREDNRVMLQRFIESMCHVIAVET